ncbi:hypothetical protein V6Z12_D07G173800 [Gossypium hirsutum]
MDLRFGFFEAKCVLVFLTIYVSGNGGPIIFEGPLCSNNGVVKLYERCLIACANYPEYWIRYVLCMEASGSMDLANNALVRATQVFVKRQPEIHLFAARFKEQNGDIEGAQAAYHLVHSEISPGLLEAIIKHANMECRLGKLEDAFSLYEQAIAIEKGKEHSQTLPMLYAQYSRFSYLVSGNAKKAREILTGALDHVQLSKPFLEALIHFETILPQPREIDYLQSLVDKFISPNSDGSAADKEDLSSIFLEAAYGAYSSYGSNYAAPQVPTSVPQIASYGVYPTTTYPMQSFPQQSYAQPTAATTLTPAQQPPPAAAAAPQAYYGGPYY